MRSDAFPLNRIARIWMKWLDSHAIEIGLEVHTVAYLWIVNQLCKLSSHMGGQRFDVRTLAPTQHYMQIDCVTDFSGQFRWKNRCFPSDCIPLAIVVTLAAPHSWDATLFFLSFSCEWTRLPEAVNPTEYETASSVWFGVVSSVWGFLRRRTSSKSFASTKCNIWIGIWIYITYLRAHTMAPGCWLVWQSTRGDAVAQ